MGEDETIIDAMCKASAHMVMCDRIAEKRKQIRDVLAHVCGNCQHWMKRECRPERVHKRFKSASSCACIQFMLQPTNRSLANTFEAELHELQELAKAQHIGGE